MAVVKIPGDLRGLTFAEQTDFASVGAAAHTAIRASGIKFEPAQSMHEYQTQKAVAGVAPDASIPGAKGGTLTFSIPMRGGGGAESTFSKLARYSCTRVARAAVTNLVVTGTSSSVDIANAAGDFYTIGDAIGLVTSDSSIQIRFVTLTSQGVTNTTISVAPDWVTNPQAGDDLVPMDTLKPLIGEPSKYLVFRFYQDGGGNNCHLFTLAGCAGTFKIASASADSVPMVEFTFMVDTWSSAATNSPALAADTMDSPRPLLGSPFYVDSTPIDVASFAFDPGLKIEAMESTTGINGRIGWIIVGQAPKPTIKPYWDLAWLTKLSAGTLVGLCMQSTKDANEGWAFWMKSAQVVKAAQGDMKGLLGADLEFKAVDANTALDESTATYFPQWAIGVTGSGT